MAAHCIPPLRKLGRPGLKPESCCEPACDPMDALVSQQCSQVLAAAGNTERTTQSCRRTTGRERPQTTPGRCCSNPYYNLPAPDQALRVTGSGSPATLNPLACFLRVSGGGGWGDNSTGPAGLGTAANLNPLACFLSAAGAGSAWVE